jgi:hypothetical protein
VRRAHDSAAGRARAVLPPTRTAAPSVCAATNCATTTRSSPRSRATRGTLHARPEPRRSRCSQPARSAVRGGRRPGGRPSRDDGCSAGLSSGNGCGRLQPTTSSTSRRHRCEQTQPLEVWLTSPGVRRERWLRRIAANASCSQPMPSRDDRRPTPNPFAFRWMTGSRTGGSRRWLQARRCKRRRPAS